MERTNTFIFGENEALRKTADNRPKHRIKVE
jgi:hypothetical protein